MLVEAREHWEERVADLTARLDSITEEWKSWKGEWSW